MSPDRGLVVVAALCMALVAVLGVAAVGDVAVADHGADGADYTVEPMEPADRQPGATEVRYGQIVVGEADVDFETLEEMRATYEEGSWVRCDGDDSEVFGIDRGNTHEGYEVDEELGANNIKRFTAEEDIFEVEFYGEQDSFGSSVHLNSGDAVVSIAGCIDNPDEPGWYQISGSTTGVTEDGDRVTVGDVSHYFWICDCENESEARDELGPPPSEPRGTTPTPTPDDGGDTGDDGDADDRTGDDQTGDGSSDDGTGDGPATDGDEDAPSADDQQSDGGADGADGGSDGGADDGDGADAAGGTDDAGATPTPGDWDRAVVDTPTPGDGDGFGAGIGLVAVVCATLLVHRIA